MRRYQLFEFLDQPWLPARLRAAAAAYLTAAYGSTAFPALWAEIVARELRACGQNRIVDLGSGSGGPMVLIVRRLNQMGCTPRVILSDLYPVRTASAVPYWPEPVNATCVPRELSGLRTMFLSFHHFAPSAARAVLRDAFEQRQPICIFEATSRTPAAIAASFLIPLLVLATAPYIRPVTAFQIFFTYVVPAVPLLALWDGLVSQLRTYSMAELKDLTADCCSPRYGWECGFIDAPRVPFRTCYLIGSPKPEAAQ